jgi:hypothetical protein
LKATAPTSAASIVGVIVPSSSVCKHEVMDEQLWALARDHERASAVARDRGVNGFDLEITVAGAVTVDRFLTRDLAILQATTERRRLERAGWR